MSLENIVMDRGAFLKKAGAVIALPAMSNFLVACEAVGGKSNIKSPISEKQNTKLHSGKSNIKLGDKNLAPIVLKDTITMQLLAEAKKLGLNITRSHYETIQKIEKEAEKLIKQRGIEKKEKYSKDDSIEILKVFSKAIETVLPKELLTTVISEGLDKKRSDCDIRSYLILHLNESLGYNLPLHLVKVPFHTFIRWQEDNSVDRSFMQNYFNWETLFNGENKVVSDEIYMMKYSITSDQIKKGIYLRNQKRNEIFSDYQAAIAAYHCEQGNDDLGLVAYNKAIETNPKNIDAYNNRGKLYFDNKEFNKAFDDFNKIIEIDPEDSMAYYNLGNHCRKFKKYRDSLAYYDQAIRLDPNCQHAYINRGVSCTDLGEYKKAIKDLTKALKLDPGNSFALFNRGIAYENLGKIKQAHKDFHAAYEAEPFHPVIYKKIKEIYAAKKK